MKWTLAFLLSAFGACRTEHRTLLAHGTTTIAAQVPHIVIMNLRQTGPGIATYDLCDLVCDEDDAEQVALECYITQQRIASPVDGSPITRVEFGCANLDTVPHEFRWHLWWHSLKEAR